MRVRYPESEDYLVGLQLVTQAASFKYNRHEDAMALADELVAATRKRFGEADGQMARALIIQASARFNAGRHEEALALFTKSLQSTRQFLGESHPDYLTLTIGLGRAQEKLGRVDEAKATAQQARALFDQHHSALPFLSVGLKKLEASLAERAAAATR
jgi:tetratricopeptide (TPR) repeat protein